MGNTSTLPAKDGEKLADYLRRKFKSKTRKLDNLVAQELREEDAEELSKEVPLQQESLRRIHALGSDQAPDLDQSLVPLLPGFVPEPFAPPAPLVPSSARGLPPAAGPAPRALPESHAHSSSRPQGGARGPTGPLPYRGRVLVQEATPVGSRTYCEDVAVGDEYVEGRICYEERYFMRRRAYRGSDVNVTDLGETGTDRAGRNDATRISSEKDLVTVAQAQTRSRFSRFRQATLNFFRHGFGGATQVEPFTDDISATSGGDFQHGGAHRPRVVELDDAKKEAAEDVSAGGTASRASRLSRRSRTGSARNNPVANPGATMVDDEESPPTNRTAAKDSPRTIRKKSGDVAIQKGPDRGIVWPRRMDEIYGQTLRAYYIDQFQRTELFRQRLARKEKGSDAWMKGLTEFQTWVIEHVGTSEMADILKPKAKVRANKAKPKVDSWRDDKTVPSPRRSRKVAEK